MSIFNINDFYWFFSSRFKIVFILSLIGASILCQYCFKKVPSENLPIFYIFEFSVQINFPMLSKSYYFITNNSVRNLSSLNTFLVHLTFTSRKDFSLHLIMIPVLPDWLLWKLMNSSFIFKSFAFQNALFSFYEVFVGR